MHDPRKSKLRQALAGIGSYRQLIAGLFCIFITTVLLAMLLQETPLKQGWIPTLIALTVLLPYGMWLAILHYYNRGALPSQRMVLLALVWGSLLAFPAAIVLEQIFDAIDELLSVSVFDTAIIAPFWEEITKGLFIVLLYTRAPQLLRGPWDGLAYGMLVGAGFGFAEDIEYLNSSLSSNGFLDFVTTYVFREILTAHAHPMFTAATGLAAGMAARQKLPLGRAFWWIFFGFLTAFALHAIFDSATVFVPLAAFAIALAYGVIFVLVLRHLSHREEVHQ